MDFIQKCARDATRTALASTESRLMRKIVVLYMKLYKGHDPEPERNEMQYALFVARLVRLELERQHREYYAHMGDRTWQWFTNRGMSLACTYLAQAFRGGNDTRTGDACEHAAQLILVRA